MLSTAIILPGEADTCPINSLRTIAGVEWDGIFYSGKQKHTTFDRALIYSSPEIIPLICDLLIVADPQFCTFDYLSFAIRNGCHLFLSDKLKLTLEERKHLILLANEGGTYIQVRNDFLYHPFQEKIRNQTSQTSYIEVLQSAPGKDHLLNEMLSNNLQMVLRAAGSVVHRIEVFNGTLQTHKPDVLNIHISFKNGSVAILTLKFIAQGELHFLSVHQGGEVTTFDFANNMVLYMADREPERIIAEDMANPFHEQIAQFVRNISLKKNPGFTLDDEITGMVLLERIREKSKVYSVTTQGYREIAG